MLNKTEQKAFVEQRKSHTTMRFTPIEDGVVLVSDHRFVGRRRFRFTVVSRIGEVRRCKRRLLFGDVADLRLVVVPKHIAEIAIVVDRFMHLLNGNSSQSSRL